MALPLRFSLLPALRLDKVGADAGISPGISAIWHATEGLDFSKADAVDSDAFNRTLVELLRRSP